MKSKSNLSKFYINFYDNLLKLLVFYDLKTLGLKTHLTKKIVKYKEILAKALESDKDVLEIQFEDDRAIYRLERIDIQAFYEVAKIQTYDNLIDFENIILFLYIYSEMEQYFFKSFKYILLKKPETLKYKTILISKILKIL